MNMKNFERLDAFLKQVNSDIYPEPSSDIHNAITGQVLNLLIENGQLKSGARVLDIGCGQGVALEIFKQHGMPATGITLGADLEVCLSKGFDVREMDMARLEFGDEKFDFIWCRHALEHSIYPFFTLAEFHRLLKDDGRLYVEVPAPDTVCHHETNPNHYSVLGLSMWRSLFHRANFTEEWAKDLNFTVPAGPDTYWSFLLKPAAKP